MAGFHPLQGRAMDVVSSGKKDSENSQFSFF
jgi:hypothetical protein